MAQSVQKAHVMKYKIARNPEAWERKREKHVLC